MARRKKKPELSAGAEIAEEDFNNRFAEILQDAATSHMKQRDSNTLTEADFRAAWRRLLGHGIQPIWRRVLTEAAVLVCGVCIAYGVQLATKEPTRVAGVALVASSLLCATLAWCLKFSKP